MAGSLSTPVVAGRNDLPPQIAPSDSARYIRDMLESLKGIAIRQDQIVLARLLEAASREAGRLARNGV